MQKRSRIPPWLIGVAALLLLAGVGVTAGGLRTNYLKMATQTSVPATATATNPLTWDDNTTIPNLRFSDGTSNNYVSACVPTTSGDYCGWNGSNWTREPAPTGGVTYDPNVAYAIEIANADASTEMHIDHGPFWTPSTTLTNKMCWRFWVKKYDNAGGYVISDGYGGSHSLLVNAAGTGNIYFTPTNAAVAFGGDDGGLMPLNQWYEVLVKINNDTGGTPQVVSYINGIPSGIVQVPASNTRSTPPPGGPGELYIGGSNHSMFNGAIAAIQGWDQDDPTGVGSAPTVPERFYSQGFQTAKQPDFWADYTHPAAVIADLSWGYAGGPAPTLTNRILHPGFPFNPVNNVLSIYQPPGAYPTPKFVSASDGPWTRTAAPTPPGGRSFVVPSCTHKICDTFSRQDQNFAFSNSPTLGSTEGGSLGAMAWQQGVSGGVLPVHWGILGGYAVVIDPTPSYTLAWVSNNAADMTAKIDNRLTTWGGPQTGIAFRVQDANNFWFCNIWSDYASGTQVRLGHVIAGAYATISLGGVTRAQHTLSAQATGTSISCLIDGVSQLTTTSSQFQTATGVGIETEGTIESYDFGLWRGTNFYVD